MDFAYYAYLARTIKPMDLARAVGRRAARLLHKRLSRAAGARPERRRSIALQGQARPPLILPEAREATASLFRERWSGECAALLAEAHDAREGKLLVFDRRVDCAIAPRGAGEPTAPLAFNRDPIAHAHYDAQLPGQQVNHFISGSDVKAAWEVGRLQFLWRYGQARWLAGTSDARSIWAQAWLHTLRQFRAACPVSYGVQWSCAMEVAARAMAICLSFGLVSDDPVVDASARAELLAMLDEHGRFIEDNLEDGGAVRTNHYLADLVGLVIMGALFPELPRAERYRGHFARELWDETLRQCRGDGTHFESSTGYQRLVAEELLAAVLAARAGGIPAPREVERAVAGLFRSLGELVKPSGRAPQIGDLDSCRALPLQTRPALDMSYAAPLGAAALCDPTLKIGGDACPPEVAWLCGAAGVSLFDALPAKGTRKSRVLPEAGIAVLREGAAYVCLTAGPNGQGGCGGHAHNDKNSVEIEWAGRDLVVDRGTFVYARDPKGRDARRSTAGHSTVQVDGAEQNRIHQGRLFALPDLAHARILDLWSRDGVEVARGEHHGYERLTPKLTHRRSASLLRLGRAAAFADELSGAGEHVLDLRWFVPHTGVRVRQATSEEAARLEQLVATRAVPLPLDTSRCVEVQAGGQALALFAFAASLDWNLAVEETNVSPGYGELLDARCLHLRAAGKVPATLCTAVLFLG